MVDRLGKYSRLRCILFRDENCKNLQIFQVAFCNLGLRAHWCVVINKETLYATYYSFLFCYFIRFQLIAKPMLVEFLWWKIVSVVPGR